MSEGRVHPDDALHALPAYAMLPVIRAAAEVCNAGNLIDSIDETEQVDCFKLRSLRACLVAIGYEYGMVVGR